MLKQVRHLIGYDVRALRLPLVVWGLVLVAQAALLLAGPAALGIDPRLSTAISYDFGVLVIRLALTAILVALVVQRDALVGTTVFWRTRPIARHRLLASKVTMVLALVVLVPWLVVCGVLLGLGLPPAAAARGATSVAVEQVLVGTFALAAATLTASLAHFVIAAFAGITLVMTLLGLLPVVAVRGSWLRTLAVGWTSEVFTAIALTGAAAVVTHQFLTLKTRRSAAVMAGALALATVGAVVWHPAQVKATGSPADASVLQPDAVRVTLGELRWNSRRPIRYRVLEHEWLLSAVLRTYGEPDGILLMPDEMEVSLAYPGEVVEHRQFDISGGGGQSTTRATVRDQPYRSVRAALGDVDLALRPNSAAMRSMIGLATVPDDVARGLTGSLGVLSGTIQFRAMRYVVAARARAAVGGTLVTDAQRLTIVSIGPIVRSVILPGGPDPDGVDFTLRSTVVGNAPWYTGMPLPPTSFLLLRHEARRQAVFLTAWGLSRFSAVLGLAPRLRAVAVWTGSVHLEFDASRSNAAFSVDEAWLRGAELLLVQPEDLGVVTCPLRVEGVPAPGK